MKIYKNVASHAGSENVFLDTAHNSDEKIHVAYMNNFDGETSVNPDILSRITEALPESVKVVVLSYVYSEEKIDAESILNIREEILSMGKKIKEIAIEEGRPLHIGICGTDLDTGIFHFASAQSFQKDSLKSVLGNERTGISDEFAQFMPPELQELVTRGLSVS